MSEQTLHVERSGRVMTVRIDNPPRNFMTGAMVGELDELTRSLEGDRSIGAVVLTGAPEGIFITHFDVDEILAGADGVPSVSSRQAGAGLRAVGAVERVPGAKDLLSRSPAAGLVAIRQIHEVFGRMNRLDKVFVAALNGLALAGGTELALACDLRLIAAGKGRIGLIEMLLGIIPGAGGTQRMARNLGPAKALELILEGRVLEPEEALELGLVNQVVAPERLLAEAQETAERLARRSPETVAAAKHAIYEGSSRSLSEGLHMERAGFMAVASTESARAAMKEYLRRSGSDPDLTPEQALVAIQAWQEGKVVDLVRGA